MNRISRSQASGLEVIAVFVGLAVLICFIFLDLPERFGVPVNIGSGFLIAGIDGLLTFLVMACLMPSWGTAFFEHIRLRKQAEHYAAWASSHHPLTEQRAECAVRAAYFAQARRDLSTSAKYAEVGMAATQYALERPSVSYYYALCLSVRASFYESEGRYQEALEDYATATRLHLEPPSLTAEYYAHASVPLYALGRFDESIQFAQQAIAAFPHIESYALTLAYRSAALSLAEQGHYADAVEHCRYGLGVQPYSWASAMLSVDQFWLLTMAGETETAAGVLVFLEKLLHDEKKAILLGAEYREVKARVEIAEGNWDEAEKLLRVPPLPEEWHAAQCYYLAIVTERRGELSEAEEWRELLVRKFPESFYARRISDKPARISDGV